jgi:hypothetical protein
LEEKKNAKPKRTYGTDELNAMREAKVLADGMMSKV